jgi:Fe-S oxidoreductase
MAHLKPLLLQGVPLVGLEPSCVASFRDELKQLFPDDDVADLLSRQTFLLPEFLDKKAKHWAPPLLESRKAIVQAHCHQHAVIKMEGDHHLLERMGVEHEILDSGCCGMAGSFGFEKDHYEVSIACGERKLLPAVRSADEKDLVIANGFSCQEQIKQRTDREGLHIAQVLRMALRQDAPQRHPERGHPAGVPARLSTATQVAIGAGLLALTAVGFLTIKRRI